MANLNNSTGSTIVLFYVVSGATLVAVQPEPVILTITNFSGSIVNAGTVTFVSNGDPNWTVLAPFLTKALSDVPPVVGSDGSLTLTPQTVGGSVASLATLITSGTNVSGIVRMQESLGTDDATLTILLRGIRTLAYALDPLAAFLAKPVGSSSNFHANVNSVAVNPRFNVALLGLTNAAVGGAVTANMELAPATFPSAGVTHPMPFSITGTLSGGLAYAATFSGGTAQVPTDAVGPSVEFNETFTGPVALKPWVGVSDTGTFNLLFQIRISDNYVFQKQSVVFTFRFRPRGAAVTVGAGGILTSADDITRTLTFVGAAWTGSISNPVAAQIPNADVPALPFSLGGGDVGDVNPGSSWTLSGTLSGLSGKFQFVELQVTVTDKAGNPFTRVQRTEIGVPSDVIALLDYSGSMSALSSVSSSETKWQRALQAATLFLDLFKLLAPTIATGGGGTAPAHQFRMGLFHWPSGALSVLPASLPLQALSLPPTVLTDNAPNSLTPITEGLKVAATSLTNAGRWRNRVTLLLTDGMQNRGTPDVGSYDSSTGGPPEPAPGQIDAQRIHSIVYAPSNTTDEAALSDLCVTYDGQYRLIDDVGDFDELLELFVAALADTTPAELVRAVSGNITIEDKVDRVVFVAVTASATTQVQLVGTPATVQTLSAAVGSDVHYVAIDNPAPGTWEIVGGGVSFFALVDLALSVKFGVVPDGVGEPATLWAEIRHNGEPVTGADIVVSVNRPGESAGQVIGSWLSSGGPKRTLSTAPATLTVASPATHSLSANGALALVPNAHHALAAPTFSSTVASALIATSPRTPNPDPLSLRRQLLTLAEVDRGLELQFRKTPHRLAEVAPGKYRFTYADTAVDGTYSFNFVARGRTPNGVRFQRDYRVSSSLAPIPGPGSRGGWTSVPLPGKKVQWTLSVHPVTRSKLPLGPGLGHALRFVPQAGEKLSEPLLLIDNLDGSYSTLLTLDEGVAPPTLALAYPLRRPPTGAAPIPLPVAPRAVRRVKITLTRLRVKDDKEWLTRRGEFAFDALVAIDGRRETAVRRRIPEDGVIRLASGEATGLQEVLYEGLVADGSRLTLGIGGAELDCFLLWQREEPLARYLRTFSGPIDAWAGQQQPGDEASDPENLADWQLWYTVDVT